MFFFFPLVHKPRLNKNDISRAICLEHMRWVPGLKVTPSLSLVVRFETEGCIFHAARSNKRRRVCSKHEQEDLIGSRSKIYRCIKVPGWFVLDKVAAPASAQPGQRTGTAVLDEANR